jgi:hypothetical protein
MYKAADYAHLIRYMEDKLVDKRVPIGNAIRIYGVEVHHQ